MIILAVAEEEDDDEKEEGPNYGDNAAGGGRGSEGPLLLLLLPSLARPSDGGRRGRRRLRKLASRQKEERAQHMSRLQKRIEEGQNGDEGRTDGMKGHQLFHFGGPVVFRLPPSTILLSSLPSSHGKYRMRRVDGEGEKEQSFLTGLLFCRPVLSSSAKKKRTTHNETESSYTVYSIRKKGSQQRSRESLHSGVLGVTHEKQNWPGGSKFNSGGPNSSCPLSLFPHLPSFLPPAIPREGKGGTGRTLTDGDSP